MTNAEKLFEELDDKNQILEIILRDCPSDYGLKDGECELCGDAECFKCWMEEVSECVKE